MAGDVYWADVKLLLHFDGSNGATTTTDTSPIARAITANGGVQLSTARQQWGTAASEHDGAGDYWSAANSSDFNFGSGDFTVEGWLLTDTVSGPHSVVGYANGSAANSNYSFYILSSGSQLQGAIYSGSTGYTAVKSGLVAGTKHHFALVRNGGTLTLYLDGVGGTGINVTSVTVNNPAASVLHIGEVQGFFSWDGMLDDLRITKGVARYTANFTPPTEAFGEGFQCTATSIDPTAAFGTAIAIADQIGVATSIDPTVAFGTADVLHKVLAATSLDPATAFGSPVAIYDQVCDATSLGPTSVIGGGALVTICVATGFGPTSVVSPAYYEFDQILYADSLVNEQTFGQPVALVYTAPDLDQVADASSLPVATRFGTPRALQSTICAATSIDPATAFGTAVASGLNRTLAATSIDPTAAFGTANGVSVHQATSITTATALGTALATCRVHATSLDAAPEFGQATADRPGAHLAYSIPGRTWFGTPTAHATTRRIATSIDPATAFGTATCRQGHRTASLGVLTRFGTAVARRG